MNLLFLNRFVPLDFISFPQSGLTHNDRSDKSAVHAVWVPPADFNGPIIFMWVHKDLSNWILHWIYLFRTDYFAAAIPSLNISMKHPGLEWLNLSISSGRIYNPRKLTYAEVENPSKKHGFRTMCMTIARRLKAVSASQRIAFTKSPAMSCSGTEKNPELGEWGSYTAPITSVDKWENNMTRSLSLSTSLKC